MATEVAVRERPILFSGPMVRAILDGKKTQTRRVVSPRNSTVLGYPGLRLWSQLNFDYDGRPGGYFTMVDGPNSTPFGCGDGVQYLHVPALQDSSWADFDPDDVVRYRVRPTYEVGDHLWVRETWNKESGALSYLADGNWIAEWHAANPPSRTNPKRTWKPSIHMPRWASRLSLEITGIRVERLQDISEGDCWAEGIESVDGSLDETAIFAAANAMGCSYEDARPTFATLWDSINGKSHPWKSNPWVWCISFKKL